MTKEEVKFLEDNEYELSQEAAKIYSSWVSVNNVVSAGFSKKQNYNEGENPYFIAVDRLFEPFHVQCDSELNTAEVIERNELRAKITVNSDPLPLTVVLNFRGINVTLPVEVNNLKELPKAQSVYPEGFEVKTEFGVV